jgi:hypothetical protein
MPGSPALPEALRPENRILWASDTDAVLYLIADGATPARGLGASVAQPVSYRPKTFAMTVMIATPAVKPATA